MDPQREFEWDEAKAESNLDRHGVPFAFVVRVFEDADHIEAIDTRRDYGEDRRNALGMIDGRLYAVTYTMRGLVCRIISARLASRKERDRYGSIPT